jgi:demethylsterigmatocystin 6-O-methyltransferase
MDALIAQVQSIAKTADEAGRKKLLDSLRDLSYSLETPSDTSQRVMYQVRGHTSPTIVFAH